MTCSKRIKMLVLAGWLVCLHPSVRTCAREPDPYVPYDDGIPAGWKLIEGDILVPATAWQAVMPKYIFRGRSWDAGVVPYEFAANVSPAHQALAREAMQEWEQVAAIDFVVRGQQADFLYIQSHATVNSSMIGAIGGRQVLNIANWDKFLIVHELGHALGLLHEHTRPDRDDYVTLDRANVSLDDNQFENNFGTLSQGEADFYGPYDFGSVMHYGQCTWSVCQSCWSNPNNCRTIIVKPPWDVTWQDAIGQRDRLSDLDALTMSFLYPESDWIFVNDSYAQAPACIASSQLGTFGRPYCDFAGAARAVPPGGTVIIQPGRYGAAGVYANPMTLIAPLGGVTLGQ